MLIEQALERDRLLNERLDPLGAPRDAAGRAAWFDRQAGTRAPEAGKQELARLNEMAAQLEHDEIADRIDAQHRFEATAAEFMSSIDKTLATIAQHRGPGASDRSATRGGTVRQAKGRSSPRKCSRRSAGVWPWAIASPAVRRKSSVARRRAAVERAVIGAAFSGVVRLNGFEQRRPGPERHREHEFG